MNPLPNLNILRFFLAMVVMLGHISSTSKSLGLPYISGLAILQKGKPAVYFFFALSGFLIIRLLYLESKKGRIHIINFYKRRMLRILPLYFIVLLAGLVIYFILLPYLGVKTGFQPDLSELLKYFLLFIPNMYIADHQNDVGGILYVLWSIGIEIQFYIFIPLLVMAFPKHVLKLLVGLYILHVILDFQFPIEIAGNYFNYYYFLVGGIVSILSHNGKLSFLGSIWCKIFLWILVVLLFLTNLVVIQIDLFYYLITAIISALFITSMADYPAFKIRFSFLDYGGKISYGLYMYHMISATGILFLFTRLHFLLQINSQAITILLIHILVIASTFIIAHLSYRYVEKYFLTLKNSLR